MSRFVPSTTFHAEEEATENYGWIREVAAVGAAVVTFPAFAISWPIIGATYVGSRILFPYESTREHRQQKREEEEERRENRRRHHQKLALPIAIGGGAILIAVVLLKKKKK